MNRIVVLLAVLTALSTVTVSADSREEMLQGGGTIYADRTELNVTSTGSVSVENMKEQLRIQREIAVKQALLQKLEDARSEVSGSTAQAPAKTTSVVKKSEPLLVYGPRQPGDVLTALPNAGAETNLLIAFVFAAATMILVRRRDV